MNTERAYRYRFYPTPEQATLLARTFGCVRFVWNAVLRYRTDAFYQRQEKIGYHDASAFLTQLKKQPDTAFLTEVSSVPLQQCLRHQQTAFQFGVFVPQWPNHAGQVPRTAQHPLEPRPALSTQHGDRFQRPRRSLLH